MGMTESTKEAIGALAIMVMVAAIVILGLCL
jgi:hypothetical protein